MFVIIGTKADLVITNPEIRQVTAEEAQNLVNSLHGKQR